MYDYRSEVLLTIDNVFNHLFAYTLFNFYSLLFFRSEQDVMYEIKQSYISLRTQLLLPFVLESCTFTIRGTISPAAASSSLQLPLAALCPTIRQAYSTLLRVAQMEVQLFDSLFKAPDADLEPSPTQNPGQGQSPRAVKASQGSGEVVSIIESICNATGDFLRPLIIHENNVDELCRVINTLSEDIKAQIDGLFPASSPQPFINPSKSYQKKTENIESSKNLLKTLNKGLNKTVSDAQERLSYCAEIKMRVEVQFFEPLPSQLSYPGIIENHEQKRVERVAAKNLRAKARAALKEGEKEGSKDNDEEDRHGEMG